MTIKYSEKGDSTEETFEAVVNDVGAINVRRLNSAEDRVKTYENLVALKCGPEDYHFMVREDGIWNSKPGSSPLMVNESLSVVSAGKWYVRRMWFGKLKVSEDDYYDDSTIYFAIMKEWD